MPRALIEEAHVRLVKFSSESHVWRRNVLRDTVRKLETEASREAYHTQAAFNHARWSAAAKRPESKVRVVEGDWGDVALDSTKKNGAIYAVLNMANAYLPGGRYLEGTAAQEENMYRRTDCHFYVRDDEIVKRSDGNGDDNYTPAMTTLLNAGDGRVYLDRINPRVCIKRSEEIGESRRGYADLAGEEYFLFYELKSAADDLRRASFDEARTRKKIRAQLATLMENGVRHVVLSAFGCGAFGNPPQKIANIYREEIAKVATHFDDIVFAIYYPGYGNRENFNIFNTQLSNLPIGESAARRISWVDALTLEVNDRKWNTKGQAFLFFPVTKVPTGIAELRRILNDASVPALEKISKIKTVAERRLANPPRFTRRDGEVSAFYQRILRATLDLDAPIPPLHAAATSAGVSA